MWATAFLALSPVAGFLIAASETDQPLLQYGAVGVLAGLAVLAVRVLFKREVDAHDRERARADRLEEELRKQNALFAERFVTTLQQASLAIQEAMNVMRDRR